MNKLKKPDLPIGYLLRGRYSLIIFKKLDSTLNHSYYGIKDIHTQSDQKSSYVYQHILNGLIDYEENRNSTKA